MSEPTDHRSDLRDHVVVRDPAGRPMADWFVEPDAPIEYVEPFVRHGVSELGWTMQRQRRATGTLPLPAEPEALPPAPEVPEKDREG